MVCHFRLHLILNSVHLHSTPNSAKIDRSHAPIHRVYKEPLAAVHLKSSVHLNLSTTIHKTILPLTSSISLLLQETPPHLVVPRYTTNPPVTAIYTFQDLTFSGIHQRQPPSHVDNTPAKPSLPTFDPKTLLNPKSAVARSNKMQSEPVNGIVNGVSNTSMADTVDDLPGMGSMIERMHGVTKREAPPLKRKSQEIEDDGEDASQKKMKTSFNTGKSSGIMGEHLKAERAKAEAQSGQVTEPIDLTNDDDGDVDEEIIFVSETLADDNKEVCLGRIRAKASVFQIPKPPRHQDGILGGQTWPQQRVDYKRTPNSTMIIDLFDGPCGGGGVKFGYMDINAASVLCPLLDSSHVNKFRMKIFLEAYAKLDGEFARQATSRPLNLSIVLYAPRNKVETIGRRLSQKQLFLDSPQNLDRGMEIVNPHGAREFHMKSSLARKPQHSSSSFHARTNEEVKKDASNIFDKLAETAKNLPEMEPKTSIITTPLLAHQKQALRFMLDHESGDDESQQGATVSLWEKQTTRKGNDIWYNIITGHKVDQKPEPERGGILADMMGLGKTLSILSLIAETVEQSKRFGETEPLGEVEDIERNARTTLIICPKSVLSNWEDQIKMHTKRKSLTFYSYHGTSRLRNLDELAKFDIILTTYNTASSEFSDRRPERKTLGAIQFFRIVLDEGHQIRTPSTKVSQACCALSAQRRWVVTGTPVQNRLDDLGSLFRFLRIKPFDDKNSWGRYILTPFRNNNESILESFRVLVDSITIRRHKDKIGLTVRHEQLQRLEFSDAEQAIYAQFASKSNSELKLMLSKDQRLRGRSYAHVLRSLLRLRAICCHGVEMLGEEDKKLLEGMTASTAIELGDEPDDEPDETFITEKHAYDAFQMMKDSEVHVCGRCGEKLSEEKEDSDAADDSSTDSESEVDSTAPSNAMGENDILGYLTPCYHLICPNCHPEHVRHAESQLTKDHYHHCQYCEQYVRFGLFELRQSTLKNILDARKAKQKGKKAKWDEGSYSGPHTKVQALLEDLKKSAAESAALPADEPPIRSVVFSGWVTYIELIEHALEQNGFNSVRLDGSMSLKARREVLTKFKEDPSVTILLVSIKAGGQGLNLTSASKVYMMEPQFNPGVELQAIDRVHRLGQKRDVHIVHYIMKQSVEESILKLQEKKKKLATMSMENKRTKAEEAKEKIEELHDLFK